ncbi:Peptidase S9, prolyl oligopeptidase active site region domain protein, partial [mine drainage metagenome]
DGVKWAIAKGYVDPNRICVFGASFGGYSSLMQPIVAPKLYKCAIDYAGVRLAHRDGSQRVFASAQRQHVLRAVRRRSRGCQGDLAAVHARSFQ